jgi:hypothetical protein
MGESISWMFLVISVKFPSFSIGMSMMFQDSALL